MSQEFSPGAQKAVQDLMAIFDCKATTRQWNAACKVVEDAAGGAMRKVEAIASFCEWGGYDYDYDTLNAVKGLLK